MPKMAKRSNAGGEGADATSLLQQDAAFLFLIIIINLRIISAGGSTPYSALARMVFWFFFLISFWRWELVPRLLPLVPAASTHVGEPARWPVAFGTSASLL